MRQRNYLWLPLVPLLLSACNTEVGVGEPTQPGTSLTYEYNLDTSAQGWVSGFADFEQGQDTYYELTSSWRALPVPFTVRGIYMSGNNHSTDLWMYVKRKIDKLKPNQAYKLTFEAEFASNGSASCTGGIGAPGESVFLKAGASVQEPLALVDANKNWRMNWDKGNQETSGRDTRVLGNVATDSTDCVNRPYRNKLLSNSSNPLTLTTNGSGELWVMFGTDSGYKGSNGIYYTRLKITAKEG